MRRRRPGLRKPTQDQVRADQVKAVLLQAATIAKVVPWTLDLATGRWVLEASATAVLGYTPRAFWEDPGLLERIIHHEDIHRLVSAKAQSEGGKPVGFDCRMAHQSGPWLWTRWTLASGPSQFHGVFQDVSELHATQEQLIQSQKAETASILVSGLCHDFNNVIAIIAGGAAYLSLQALPDEQHEAAASILKSAERCQDLVRQLLGFARKYHESPRTPRSMNSLAKEALLLLAHVRGRNVQLQTDLAPEALEVMVEPGQIIQVLLNLGLNALHALAGAGTLTLRTGRQHLGPQESVAFDCPQGPYVFLDVQDSGSGIAPDVLGKIYDPFFTTKPPGQGTGLGLTMAQAILKEHDGHIQCWSEVGQGTTFRILVPERRPSSSGQLPPGLPGRRLRVLMVEDAEPDAILILAALRGGGFDPQYLRVETAEGMARALAEEGPWDVILSDHIMPRFNGFSALALARERAAGVPFIFVAGARGEAFAEMGLRAGARDCVPKHRLERLGSVIEGVLKPGAQCLGQPPGAAEGVTTVLFADDDADFLASWARILRRTFKLQVLEARDGQEAVDIYCLNEGIIALAILDCNMPGLSGPEAFAAIRTKQPGALGILCSADPEEVLREHVRACQFLGFLKKPFTLHDLDAVLRKAAVVS